MATPLLVVGPHQVGQTLREYKIADFLERCNNSMLKDRGYAGVTPERFTLPCSNVVQHVFFYPAGSKEDMLTEDELRYVCDLYKVQGWRGAVVLPYQKLLDCKELGEFTGLVSYALHNSPDYVQTMVEHFPEHTNCLVLLAGASVGNWIQLLNLAKERS